MAFRESKTEEPYALTASLALSLQVLTRVILCLTFPLLMRVLGPSVLLGRVSVPSLEPPWLQLPLFPHRQQQGRCLRKQEAPGHHRKHVCTASPPPAHCKTPTALLPQAPHRGWEKRSCHQARGGADRPWLARTGPTVT